MCQRIVLAAVNCEAGYSWNSSASKCQRVVNGTLTCPATHTWNEVASKCQLIETAQRSCPTDFSWNAADSKCYKITDADRSCRNGFDLNSDGLCERTVVDNQPAIPVCEAGFDWNSGTQTCRRTRMEYEPAIVVCQLGYSFDDATQVCQRITQESVQATPVCAAEFSYHISSKTCRRSRVESISATRSCADSFAWNGSTCFKTWEEQEPANRTCPATFDWDSSANTCSKSWEEQISATRSCASQFIWDPEIQQCSNTTEESITATRSCPAQYNWNGSICQKTWDQEIPASPLCDDGYDLSPDASTCSKTTLETGDPSVDCPIGFSLTGEASCSRTRTQTLPATAVCDDGWSYQSDSNTCRKITEETQPATPACQEDYTWNPSSSVCRKTIESTVDAIASCPVSFTLNATTGQCERNIPEVQSATPVCQTGWDYEPTQNLCQRTRELTLPASPTCTTPGYTYSHANGVCQKSTLEEVPAQVQCSDLFTYDGSTCRRIIEQSQAPNLTCNGDYVLNASNFCQRILRESEPATRTCSVGFNWSNSSLQCEQSTTEAKPAIPQCLENWLWNGNQCYRVVKEEQPSTRICETGMIFDPARQTCFKVVSEKEAPVRSCQPGSNYNSSNSLCESVVTETQEPVPSCSIDYSLSSDQTRCTREVTDYTEIYHSCPSGGYTYNDAGSCIRVVQDELPATRSCDPGFVWNDQNDRCESGFTETKSPSYLCDAGWEFASGTTCTRTIEQRKPATVVNEKSCPADWTNNGARCVRGELQTSDPIIARFEYSCSSGFSLDDDQCYRDTDVVINASIDQQNLCLDGWSDTGINCSQSRVVQEPSTVLKTVYRCPDTYSLNSSDNVCYRSAMESTPFEETIVYSCESGWTKADAGCERQVPQIQPSIVLDVTFGCPTGWQKDGANPPFCHRVETESITADINETNVCSDPFVIGSSQCEHTYMTTIPSTVVSVSYSCAAGFALNSASNPPRCFGSYVDEKPIQERQEDYCEQGFTDTGSDCYQKQTFVEQPIQVGTTYSCPDGKTLDGEFCFVDNSATLPAILNTAYSCPQGFSDTGSRCERTREVIHAPIVTNVNYSCAKSGWNLNSSTNPPTCFGDVEISQPATAKINNDCPDPTWNDTGTHCEKDVERVEPSSVVTVDYWCYEGWTLDESISPAACYQINSQSRAATATTEYFCLTGEGWSDSGSDCERYDLVEYPAEEQVNQSYCNQGFTLNNSSGLCEKSYTQSLPAVAYCQADSTSTGTGTQEEEEEEDTSDNTLVIKQARSAPQLTGDVDDSSTPVHLMKAMNNPVGGGSLYNNQVSPESFVPTPTGDCMFLPEAGVTVCEGYFNHPIPDGMELTPFCKKINVINDADFYKGSWCFTDANGVEVCGESDEDVVDAGCAELSANDACDYVGETCVEGARGTDGVCYATELTYNCGEWIDVPDIESETEYTCEGPIQCMGADCIDVKKTQSDSFNRVQELTHTMQFMGIDMGCEPLPGTDQMECEVFKGEGSQCSIYAFGIQDCCDVPSNGDPMGLIIAGMALAKANASIMALESTQLVGGLSDTVGAFQQLSTSTTTMFSNVSSPFVTHIESMTGTVSEFFAPVTDVVNGAVEALMTFIEETIADFINLMVEGATNAAGSAAADAGTEKLGEELIGDVGGNAAEGLATDVGAQVAANIMAAMSVIMLVYTIYNVAVMIISLIHQCKENEFALAGKRAADSCTYLGSYCAKEDLLGITCVEKAQSYCCYNSPLARIVNEQVMAINGVTPDLKNPSCPGLTTTELQNLDWSQIDLSEWTAMLTKYGLNPEMTADDINFDMLSGTGSMYNDVFFDDSGERPDAATRAQQRLEGFDVDEAREEARENTETDVEGCSTCGDGDG
ncbi:conjugal transfer protein TraN [uncultured Umboniibacter sp.]|uniref:conjugal transfer protein TraN n=1 Tax=uncultured Umboniibacter sp. TaxID=1798917 RepID=UPI002619E845|nr:conjugal transfer protein TraN [uncultured Umboniibacter sp.]